jgi:hypothetical protein
LSREQTYRGWAWRFAHFLGKRPVESATGEDVRSFLSQLATVERVGASAQKQALNALVFLLREVEGKALGDFGEFTLNGSSLTRNLYDDIERETRASVSRMDLAVESDTDELTV